MSNDPFSRGHQQDPAPGQPPPAPPPPQTYEPPQQTPAYQQPQPQAPAYQEPTQQWQAPPPEPPAAAPGLGGDGAFSWMFDVSFSKFVTITIVRIFYGLGMVLSVIAGAGVLITGLAEGGASVVIGLIVGPLVVFLGILFTRIWCEAVIIVFRLGEHAREIAANTRR